MEPDCCIFLNRKSPDGHLPGPLNDYNRKIKFTKAWAIVRDDLRFIDCYTLQNHVWEPWSKNIFTLMPHQIKGTMRRV